ncbi:failed axon connections homolog [Folsomia candida]|uniref:failed axon connections homolog n=1 Tax=Folsomia candida TaxID=158441 RepID=UPI000B9066E0|nr:failed axon connections homolog [Folsomia candida]
MTLLQSIPSWVKDCSFVLVTVAGGLWTLKKIRDAKNAHFAARKAHENLLQWSSTPKDVVILHTIGRGKTAPSPSPFVVKLETFLRMANIPYEMDFTSPWSSKAKTPWISLNGEHIADSQLIIEFLSKKFGISLGSSYSADELAKAQAVRVMMDEHFYWGLGLWRYVYSGGAGLSEFMAMSPSDLATFFRAANARVKTASWFQGVGRHDQDTVVEIMNANLEAVSRILGEKRFLLGEEPCAEDCSLFGFLVQVFWCAPGSPYKSFVEENLPNLKAYCGRMKTLFWDDWEKCLA